ncbi:MAG: AAA family ATPase, partial [Spirochaetes bacterium]|nr:AAA family ATPase [Spirochaetota bacterium]
LKPGVTSSYIEDVIRFKREVEAVSKFNHPDIIKFYSSGDYKNLPYIVMELLEGNNLIEILKEGHSFNIKDTIIIIKKLTEALDYVHSKGIIHRDIKPSNIMICNPLSVESRKSGVTPPQRTTVNGKRATVNIKLLDFGLALVMELSQIKEKKIIGTFEYMSPEATGIMKRPIDERSDLYSLGIIFYQLLTGELPFKAREISSLLHQQVTKEATPVTRINSDIPNVIAEIITKLMAKEQELRYQSAKGLLYDIDRFYKGEYDFIVGEKDQKVKLSYQTRLVGREEELERIINLHINAKESKGAVCLITGEAGLGKTRLIEATKEYIFKQGYKDGGLFIQGRCLNQENKMPYQPFRDSINEYIKKLDKMDIKSKKKEINRIKDILGDLGEVIIRLNPNMKEVLGKVPKLIELEGDRENQRFLMVASNFFCNIAPKGMPSVLFLDDLQWADQGSLSLIGEILEKIEKTNLLILGTYRHDEITKWHSLNIIK